MTQGGIYAIVHHESGRRYIGSTVNFSARKLGHFSQLRRGVHGNHRLRRAWAKYGADAFSFEIIEVVSDSDNLHQREQFYLDQYLPNVFNTGTIAKSPWLGVKKGPMSPETRARISAANKGRKPHDFTPETRLKMSLQRKGKPNPYGPEQRAKIIAANKRRTGEKHTDAARRKISAANIGRSHSMSDEGKAKMREIGKRRTYSAETRLKMSESAMRRWSQAVERDKQAIRRVNYYERLGAQTATA